MAFSRTGSADERQPEYKVKAAFLFHFAEYAEWPSDAFPHGDSPLVIGVIGRGDPFNGDLEAIVHDKRTAAIPSPLRTILTPRHSGRVIFCSSVRMKGPNSIRSFRRPAAARSLSLTPMALQTGAASCVSSRKMERCTSR